MKFMVKVFCAFALMAHIPAMPAPGADRGPGNRGGKPAAKESPGKGKVSGRITVRIAGGEVQDDNKVIRVKQGDAVRLNLIVDKTTEVHLHGYDIKKTVSPGGEAVMAFRARVAGRFSVTAHGFHSHGQKKGGGHSEKVLFYLEVHP